ncbi:Uncharacterised protein [Klebsiella variicola]|nr:Uncharacterised protein [Klebsiella variicola]
MPVLLTNRLLNLGLLMQLITVRHTIRSRELFTEYRGPLLISLSPYAHVEIMRVLNDSMTGYTGHFFCGRISSLSMED